MERCTNTKINIKRELKPMYLNLNTELILKIIITLLLVVICILYYKISRVASELDLLATVVFKEIGAIGYMSDSQKKLVKIVEGVLEELKMEPSDPEDLNFKDPLEKFKEHIGE